MYLLLTSNIVKYTDNKAYATMITQNILTLILSRKYSNICIELHTSFSMYRNPKKKEKNNITHVSHITIMISN